MDNKKKDQDHKKNIEPTAKQGSDSKSKVDSNKKDSEQKKSH